MSEQPIVNPTAACAANTVPIVPDDWAALGAKAGYDPKPAEMLNLFIVGPSGEGKTTFESSIPNNLILDFDNGANAVPGGLATRIYIRDFPHLEAVTNKLVADAKDGKRRFTRVSYDTIDEFVSMIKHMLEEEKTVDDITEFGRDGHGYNLILERLWSKVLDVEQAGYAWSFIGHLKTKQETDPVTKQSVTKIRESVYPGVAKKILTKSDFKLTVYCIPQTIERKKKVQIPGGKTIEVPDGIESRRVYHLDSLTTAEKDNKGRGVPDMEGKFEIPLINGWQEFKKRYDAAVEVARKKYQ